MVTDTPLNANFVPAGATARTILASSTGNIAFHKCSLDQLLVGILSVFAWAADGLGPARHLLSMPDLAQQVGSAAIFLAGDRLCRSHVGKKASAALEVALSALICWLFPDDSHFGRTHGGGVRAIAGVACAHGLLLLKARRHTKLAKQVGRVLTREQRAVFWPELFRDVTASRREVAVHELMHLQLLAVRGQGMCLTHYGATADDLNILYQWFGPSRYVGKARLVRDSRPQVPGVGQRFLEHFLRWKRPHLKGADVTRYAKFRRTSATGMAFLVCRAGPERMISAAEIVEIRRHCPEANVQGNPLAQRQRVTRRSRPPASQRRRSQYAAKAFPGTFEGPFAGQQLQAALKSIGRARDWHDRFQHPDLGQLLQYNFRRGYAHYVQAWMASTGCIGPVNIYSRQKWKLLAMFLGTFGCEIDWALLDKHWGAPCAMIELWSKLRRWLPYRKKLLAQQKLDMEFRRRGLPGTRGLAVKVPRSTLVRAVRRAVRKLINSRVDWDDRLKGWAHAQIRVVTGRAPRFCDAQNCSRLARRFDWSVVGGADPLTFDMAQVSSKAKRFEHNWLLAARPTKASDVAAVRKAVSSVRCLWSQACHRHAAISTATQTLLQSPDWLQERTHFQRSHAPYALLRDSLQFPRGHVVCPDDKVRQFRWVMPYTAYFLLIAWFVSVSQTWTTSSMSTDEANSWCRAMLLALVPPLLHARMGITRRGWFLPYMYGTVKAKCFGSGPDAGKHVCNKPGHSCLRRIVSYATWKARRSWRAAGRALSFIAQSVLLTDEVPSLKQARPFMGEGLERLQPCREVHVCDRCHGPCEGLQGIVADAGQFFEAVQVPDACEAADRVLNLAELDGHSSVTVAGKKHVFFGGSIYRSMQQCLVFSLEELYWLFTAACNMRFAHTGTQVWTFSGLPIGGLLSKTATSFVLGWQEHCWRTDRSRRQAAGFGFPDRLWPHLVARARYVDDVLWLSRALCEGCLRDGIRHVYAVPFEVEGPVQGALSWLDFRIELKPLRWTAKRKEFIALPPWAVQKQYAFGILLGRVSRWSEMGLGPAETSEALLALFVDFYKHGWSKKALRKAVYRVAQRCSARDKSLMLRTFHWSFCVLSP